MHVSDNSPTPEIVLDVPADVVSEEMASWKWQPPAEYVDYWARRSSSTVRWPKLAPCATRRVAEKETVDALLAKDGKSRPPSSIFTRHSRTHAASRSVAAGLLRRWAVGRRPSDTPA